MLWHHQGVQKWKGPISSFVFCCKLYAWVNAVDLLQDPVCVLILILQKCQPHISSILLEDAQLCLWP